MAVEKFIWTPIFQYAVKMEAVHCQQQRRQWPDMRKLGSVLALALPMVNAGIGHIIFYSTVSLASNSGSEVAKKDFSVNAVAKERKLL